MHDKEERGATEATDDDDEHDACTRKSKAIVKTEEDIDWTPPDKGLEETEKWDNSDGGKQKALEGYCNSVSQNMSKESWKGNEQDNQNNDNASTKAVSLEQEKDIEYGKSTETHNIHSVKKPRNDLSFVAQAYEAVIAHKVKTDGLASLDSSLRPLVHVMLTKYGIRRGLKLFDQREDDAIKTKISQLHNREVLLSKSASALRATALHR